MFCDRCGAENKDTASFCRKCGQAFDGTEVETRVASRQPEYIAPVIAAPIEHQNAETVKEGSAIFDIHPTLLFVKAGYVAAAIAAMLLVALLAALTPVPIIYAIVIGLLIFVIPAYFHIRQKLVRYKLTETSLELDSGLLASTTRNIPLRRIQDVTVSATALQRIAGLGDIVIDNASEEGGKVALRHVDRPRVYADMLLKQMARLDK
ncbi:MAG TPA: PH domain-containing protein [Pyrinomonadaceae bacterium]|jgi:membrane protein YdbS with pleckstrin-like domain